MKKMKTLFEQDEHYLVIPVLRKENEFIYTGDYEVYRKRDGTAVMIKDNIVYKRYDANPLKGRKVPEGAIPCQDEIGITGSFPVWIEIDNHDKRHLEVFNSKDHWEDGTYELCGKNVNRNKEHIGGHTLIKHDSEPITDVELTYDGIKQYLSENVMEGLVIVNTKTGLMAKIRRKDYGMEWNG